VTLALPGSPPGPNNLDQQGSPRRADTRNVCDIGAYDSGGPVTIAIAKGWNLVDVPLHSSSTGSASGLVGSLNGQLGAGTVTALATYSLGAFHLYVSGYTADQTLGPSSGIFVLSGKAGPWTPPGTAYSSSQSVSLQRGWNLVGAPFPSGGLDGSAINAEIGAGAPSGGCGLQEVATYSNGYHVHAPTVAYHVAATAGMWILCTKSYAWTPS
jgi:hypothetical protein